MIRKFKQINSTFTKGCTTHYNPITDLTQKRTDETKQRTNLTLQAIAILCLLTNNIEYRIDQFRALGIMPFRPIIPRARLPEHEVVRPEDLPERTGSDRVHRPRLQVHEDCAWDVPPTAGLIIVNVDPLKLKLRVATVLAGVINAVLVADHLPKFGANLIAALATLNVQDFPHLLV